MVFFKPKCSDKEKKGNLVIKEISSLNLQYCMINLFREFHQCIIFYRTVQDRAWCRATVVYQINLLYFDYDGHLHGIPN